MNSKKPVVVDLFAGAGGLSLGFKRAGFKVAAHVEIDRWACETLKRNFKTSVVLQDDIEKLDPQELVEKVGKIDVVVGGPPCQGFSLVGKAKLRSLGVAHDKRNGLYKQFVRFVHTLNPRAFVMENVPSILSHHRGITASRIKQHFELLGYTVYILLLNAADYGVPQTRKRAFFVGIKNGAAEFKPPRQTCGVWRTVENAISDLPSLAAGEASSTVSNHVARNYGEMDLQIFTIMKQGMKYYQIPDKLKRYRTDAFKDKYRRLIAREPSWTVLAHLQKDGYMYIHPTQNRTITVREAARLQSFPDKFIFCGPMTQQFKQVGNAVPPLLARAVARSLLKTLVDPRATKQKLEIVATAKHVA